jgi:DNA-directed RNA polymerase subunit beta
MAKKKSHQKQFKKIDGQKLEARVVRTWNEDFVDEETGEVVTIPVRNSLSKEKPYRKKHQYKS